MRAISYASGQQEEQAFDEPALFALISCILFLMSLNKVLSSSVIKALREDKARFYLEKKGSSNPRYDDFKSKYWNDRVGFIKDCIKWPTGTGPTEYQLDIAKILDSGATRLAVRAPHNAGKSALTAMLILHYALTRAGKDWKVVTTASVWRQLIKYLWPEIHKWARMVDWDKVGRKSFNSRTELTSQSLRILNEDGKTTGEAFPVASNNFTAIEGAHADHILYVLDEAKAIPDGLWDAAEGALNGTGEAIALAVSTPGPPEGRFYEIHTKREDYSDWQVKHITLNDMLESGRVREDWVESRKRQWGENSPLFKNRVKGEFAATELDGVLPLAWVEAAMERWDEIYGDVQNIQVGQSIVVGQASLSPATDEIVTDIGADIGGGGEHSNATVEAIAVWPHILQIHKNPRGSADVATMETAGRIKSRLEKFRNANAYIDAIGIGAGVFHRLKEHTSIAARVMPFNAGTRTPLKDQNGEMSFANKRAAMWWIMREMLDPENDIAVCIPRDDRLLGELTTVHYTIRSNGAIQIEEKKDIAKRLKGSTDIADAVIMALTGGKIAKIADTQIYQIGVGYVDA